MKVNGPPGSWRAVLNSISNEQGRSEEVFFGVAPKPPDHSSPVPGGQLHWLKCSVFSRK
jgi:hypothetical protein